MKQNTAPRPPYLCIIFSLATTVLAPATARAQGKDKPAPDSEILFESKCSSWGVKFVRIYERDRLAAWNSPPKFTPNCSLEGTDAETRFLCECGVGQDAIAGTSDPIDVSAKEPSEAREEIAERCKSVFREQCGIYPEPIQRSCEHTGPQGKSSCAVSVEASGKGVDYDSFHFRCECANLWDWNLDFSLANRRSFTVEQAESICEEHVKQCEQVPNPGPSARLSQLVPQEDLRDVSMMCGESPVKSETFRGLCNFMPSDKQELHKSSCICPDLKMRIRDEEVGFPPSIDRLSQSCTQAVPRCAQKPSPNDLVIDLAKLKMECAVSSPADPKSWLGMVAFLAVMSLTGRRKERDTTLRS